MGSLSRAKTLGGIGSILTLLLFVPYNVGAVLVIVGWVLVLLAVKDISDAVKDKSIFNNAIISIALSIAATAVFAVVVAEAVLGFMGMPSSSTSAGSVPNSNMFGIIASVIGGLVVVWILAVVSSFFLWRSFKQVSLKVNIGYFRTGGLIYFIGSILTIVLVGFILDFVAEILFVVAFFSLPEDVPAVTAPGVQPAMGPQSNTSSTTASMGASPMKTCVNCGASLDKSASFCPKCGVSQPVNI